MGVAAIDAQVQSNIDQITSQTAAAIAAATAFLNGLEVSSFQANPIAPLYVKWTPAPIVIDATKPSRPTMGISLPVMPNPPKLLDLDAIFPQDDIKEPNINFTYTEKEYMSDLLTQVKARLLANVENGFPILSPAVEDAIWQRQQERDLLDLTDEINTVIDTWASKGMTMPDGYIAAKVDEKQVKYFDHRRDITRDIAIKQAELAQKNTEFVITSSLTLETMMIQHADNVANRALKAAEVAVTLGVEIYKAVILWYTTKLEAYKAKTWAEVETNKMLIEQFTSMIAVFKAQAEVAIEQLRATIEMYSADLRAYGVEVQKGEATANIQVKQGELVLTEAQENSRLALDAATKNMQSFIQSSTATMNHQSSMGSVFAQYVSAAYNAMNIVLQMASIANDDTTG